MSITFGSFQLFLQNLNYRRQRKIEHRAMASGCWEEKPWGKLPRPQVVLYLITQIKIIENVIMESP